MLEPREPERFHHGVRHPAVHGDAGHEAALEAVLPREIVFVDLVLVGLDGRGRADVMLGKRHTGGQGLEGHGRERLTAAKPYRKQQ